MDVISEILALSRVSGSVLAEIDCRGAWAIDMLNKDAAAGVTQQTMPFHYLLEGEGYLKDGGSFSPLCAGDLVVAPAWPAHAIVADPAYTPVSITEIIAGNGMEAWSGGSISRPLTIIAGEGQHSARILSGVFSIDGQAVDMLISQLPSLLKLSIREDTLDEQFTTALSFIRQEGQRVRPGYIAVAERLTELLFIQILRSCMMAADVQIGLLAALSDKSIARALGAIHAEPAAAWTVASLAKQAFLSRTVFADRFRDLVGVTPIQYVNRWRMIIAQNLLIRTDLPVGIIQERVGFSGSFAFSRAFRQAFGTSPRAYRKTGGSPIASVQEQP